MKRIILLSLGLLLTSGCINEVPTPEREAIDMEMSLMTCTLNSDCPAGSYCDECTGSSCPTCDDCIRGCLPTCDSETLAECDLERPECGEDEVSIIREGCWLCVDQNTCEPITTNTDANCDSDQDCPVGESCNQCATASCSGCNDCVGLCQDSPCESEDTAECDLDRPACRDGFISIIREGCWLCVDQNTCEPVSRELEPSCNSDQDCAIGEYCNQCAAASCPYCDDCIALCQAGPCESEEVVECEVERPLCAEGFVSVVRDGCWLCVDRVRCEPNQPQQDTCMTNDDCEVGDYCDECATSSCEGCLDCIGLCTVSSCESEAEVQCEVQAPSCEPSTVLIIRDGCWLCVDQNSCEAMSMEEPINECQSNADCSFGSICDPCARSSCPACDDCISACRSVCDSEEASLCFSTQPECDETQVLIVRDGCWLCVSQMTCEP